MKPILNVFYIVVGAFGALLKDVFVYIFGGSYARS